MNGALVQARIYAGYKKGAARVGRPYAHYRAASAINPIAIGNLLGTVDCMFGPNPNFILPHKFKIPSRSLYADGSVLAQHDILVGPYGTMYVADMQPLLPMQMVLCNESLSIGRLSYPSGTTQVITPLATAMPAFSQLKKVDQKSVTGIGGSSAASTAIAEFFVFLPIARNLVLEGDIITNSAGIEYMVDTIDNTEIGVVLTMHQAQSQ